MGTMPFVCTGLRGAAHEKLREVATLRALRAGDDRGHHHDQPLRLLLVLALRADPPGPDRWRATAWMEAFFLPHSVITTSPALEFLRWQVGTYCFSLGILAAVLLSVQVYTAKLVRREVAQSWVYSRIRHPFYLSLAVAGFGLLTIWPRIIILVLYVGMLLAYYFLARLEESQMEAKFPEYADYRRRTAMFIPGEPGGKLFRLFFLRIPSRPVALAVSSVAVVALVIGSGLLLRR